MSLFNWLIEFEVHFGKLIKQEQNGRTKWNGFHSFEFMGYALLWRFRKS